MNKFRSALLLCCLLVILLGAGAVSVAESPMPNESITALHPIMHPSETTLQRWIDEYEAVEPVLIDQTIKNRAIQSTGSKSLLSQLPYNAAERNQNPIGNCWVWAGTGVLEVAHTEQTGIMDRLSIQYLDSNFNGGSGPDWAGEGGSLTDFVQFYNQKQIAVPWSNTNAGFQDGRLWSLVNSQAYVSAASIQTTPHYDINSITEQRIQTRGVSQVTAIAGIKAVLNQNRAVYFAFRLPNGAAWDDFNTFWDTKGEETIWDPSRYTGSAYDSSTGGGHAVVCVGYDDTDPTNRYWILLNSWGTAGGKRPSGIFRMKMDINYSATYAGSFSNPMMQWETESVKFSATPQPTYVITTVPTTIPTTQVPSGVVPIQSNGNLPTDPDHDGTYEDLNGNGVADFNDITLFFNQMDWIGVHEPAGAFDFNRNGRVDFNDVVLLFRRI